MAKWHCCRADRSRLEKVLVGDQLWKRHVDQMHQQRGSQIDHAKRNANISVTPPNVVSNQDVVDVPAITSPQSETAEVPKKEPISEPGNDATAHRTASAQSQAQPRYPTRQRKAPRFRFIVIRTVEV